MLLHCDIIYVLVLYAFICMSISDRVTSSPTYAANHGRIWRRNGYQKSALAPLPAIPRSTIITTLSFNQYNLSENYTAFYTTTKTPSAQEMAKETPSLSLADDFDVQTNRGSLPATSKAGLNNFAYFTYPVTSLSKSYPTKSMTKISTATTTLTGSTLSYPYLTAPSTAFTTTTIFSPYISTDMAINSEPASSIGVSSTDTLSTPITSTVISTSASPSLTSTSEKSVTPVSSTSAFPTETPLTSTTLSALSNTKDSNTLSVAIVYKPPKRIPVISKTIGESGMITHTNGDTSYPSPPDYTYIPQSIPSGIAPQPILPKNVTIKAPSAAGAVHDPKDLPPNLTDDGYPDGSPEADGFVRGWYGGVYWRVSKPSPGRVVGGIVGNEFMFDTADLDQGYAATRMMLLVSGVYMFCRAVAPEVGVIPEIACVKFDNDTGAVLDPYYMKGVLGTLDHFLARPIMTIAIEQQPVQNMSQIGWTMSSQPIVDGFKVGWYDGVFWRVAGEYPNQYVVGGIPGHDLKYSTQHLDQGLSGTRIIANVMGYGNMFCRGVGNDVDPFMACIQFERNGQVADEYALFGRLGQWSNYNK